VINSHAIARFLAVLAIIITLSRRGVSSLPSPLPTDHAADIVVSTVFLGRRPQTMSNPVAAPIEQKSTACRTDIWDSKSATTAPTR